jgi:hypothetical protein
MKASWNATPGHSCTWNQGIEDRDGFGDLELARQAVALLVDHLTVVNAINALNHRWHRQHSDKDGSEFTVEGLYSPHLDLGSRGVPVSIEDLGSTCLTQIAGFVAMVSLPFMPTSGQRGSASR